MHHQRRQIHLAHTFADAAEVGGLELQHTDGIARVRIEAERHHEGDAGDDEGGAVLDAGAAIKLIEDAIGVKLQVAPAPSPVAKKKAALRRKQRSKNK